MPVAIAQGMTYPNVVLFLVLAAALLFGEHEARAAPFPSTAPEDTLADGDQIGRASCRERV